MGARPPNSTDSVGAVSASNLGLDFRNPMMRRRTLVLSKDKVYRTGIGGPTEGGGREPATRAVDARAALRRQGCGWCEGGLTQNQK